MTRPSYRELDRKLSTAKMCIFDSTFKFENPTQFVIDAAELGFTLSSGDLLTILREIKPEHYAGEKPPERSYKSNIRNCELFTFVWQSSYLDQVVYLKFAIKNDTVWFISLHQPRHNRS